MGRGSSTVSSAPDRRFSSSMSRMDGCRKSTALIVCTGDDEPDEPDELVVDVDADDKRRRDVRRLLGEKRERIVWKRDVCMLDGR